MIEFGRFAAGNRRGRGEGKPEAFEFLGFTHLCSKRRSDGGYKLLRHANAKRQRSKLRQIKEALMRNRHRHPYKVGAWLQRIVQGYYFAVPDNLKSLSAFRREVSGDVFIGDAFFPTFFFVAAMQARGVDILMEQQGARKRRILG
ncbi:MAG: hypothetical protein KZQ99_19090 [Candidatus Thiodiazotropha sp. (ex Dulcina madagascariensis)]|nr:hypothetical protein [Candidatus Thiodiazotropha sp. (ex Dulcina madagascariensis)]